jgi:type IV fimbrial biogenesis protein FimT
MRPSRAAGFTLMEAMIAMVIMGIMLAVGLPNMSGWLRNSRAVAATEFYAEGIKTARAEALRHNSASRILLTENPRNGQMDWQVDICFPTALLPLCSDETGSWSTTVAPSGGDPEGANGFRSVFRAAADIPNATVLTQSLRPSGATDIYFNSLGWLNPTFGMQLRRIDLAPAPGHAGEFPAASLRVSLAGMVAKCDPTVAAGDSRMCPP